MHDIPMEVLLVDGIVRAESRCVVVEHDGFILVGCIVTAEVLDESRDFAVKLDIERFNDVEPTATRLSGYNPVVIGNNTTK